MSGLPPMSWQERLDVLRGAASDQGESYRLTSAEYDERRRVADNAFDLAVEAVNAAIAEAEARTWAKARSSTFVDAALAAEREAGRAEVNAACERLADANKNGTITLWAWGDDIGWEVAPDDVSSISGHPTAVAAILAAARALDGGEVTP